jgi:hypothetical protein
MNEWVEGWMIYELQSLNLDKPSNIQLQHVSLEYLNLQDQ